MYDFAKPKYTPLQTSLRGGRLDTLKTGAKRHYVIKKQEANT